MTQTFIVGIIDDKTFGPLARPLIITKYEEKGFFPIEAQLAELNYDYYAPHLTPQQKMIYEAANEYSEKNLYKLFGSKKDKTVKEFLNRVKPEEVKKHIRPFIERKIARLTDLLRQTEVEVYFKEKHKFINRDSQILVQKDQASTLFNIEKGSQETRYNLSVIQNGEEINLLDKSYLTLSHDPCRMVIDNRLYAFEDVDASKLKPFFAKEHIFVPKQFERKWFETFALPNIKKYRVNATGFDIENITPPKEPWLVLTHALDYKPTLLLSFYYGKEFFYPNQSQTNKVILEYQDNHFRFFKIERDTRWEQNRMDRLKQTGLISETGNYFVPSGIAEEDDAYEDRLHALIEWLRQHVGQLKEAGFRIDQKLDDKTYSLSEFQMESLVEEKNDWFDVKATVKIGDYQIPFIQLKKYILQGIREIQLPDGRYAVLPAEWFSTYADLFKFGKVDNDRLHIHKHHFRILQQSLHQFRHSYLDRLQNLSEELQTHEISVPTELLPTLRPYQLKGYQWMNLLNKHEFGGCLADDMGLGKTIQTLTLLLHIKKTADGPEQPVQREKHAQQLNLFDLSCNQGEPTTETLEQTAPVSLIVMPTSLIYNWENEINKFTPQLSAYRFTGMNRTRQADTLCGYDVVLTTYGVVRNDYELLKQVPFHYIILDESQYIKNPSSKIYKAVNELQSRHKLVLTGTPIENSLIDLWAQFNFLNKGLLGSYHFFKNEFIHPIEKHNNQEQEAKLQAIIDPFILRRTKNQVAKELPEKTEQVIYCEMTEAQWSYYESEKSKIRNALIENLEEHDKQDNLKILDGLSRLRQIANHPRMLDEDYQEDSGKYREIIDYLESLISEDHKVLVFSSYKKHLRILESHFHQIGWQYSLLTGETQNRQKVINEFQEQEANKIFLIQIKAGGFGLNLTAADYVLILDPWWNPAVEEQAINRAHRIGQDKKVMVYRFISAGTVEEKIRGLQSRKARLAETFITPTDTLKKLTKEQLMELFR